MKDAESEEEAIKESNWDDCAYAIVDFKRGVLATKVLVLLLSKIALCNGGKVEEERTENAEAGNRPYSSRVRASSTGRSKSLQTLPTFFLLGAFTLSFFSRY